MPKLPDVKFFEQSATDQYTISCKAKVEAHSGKFELTINEELHDQILLLNPPGVFAHVVHEKRGLGIEGYTVTSMNMTAARDAIRLAIKNILATEIEEQMFITYFFETTCHWWENRDGTISANGSAADADHNGQWNKTARYSGYSGNIYSLGLYAKVVVKQLHKNARGVTEKEVHLTRSEKFSDRQKYNVAHRLNDFSHMVPPAHMTAQSMPYTDEAAAFFYGLLLNLSATSKRIGDFFADKSAVTHAIENQSSIPLLSMGSSEAAS